jgi:NADH-quinone oxidoreductase subunit I
MKHMFQVLGGKDRVIQYPEERREELSIEEGGINRPTYHGVHRLNKDENGRVSCVACFMCSTACPARCISIEAGEAPWPDREKYPVKFEIDELKCIYCGMCEEACPVDAIELTSIYDIIGKSRQEMIFDKEKLLAIYDQTVAKEPM